MWFNDGPGHTQWALPLVITEGSGPALLGRNWLEALRLDWTCIFCTGNNLSLQQILAKHADVFKEELGVPASVHVSDKARPRFVKSQQVPFAMRAKVEKELDRLLALGVIRPVQFSDWAAPIIPVLSVQCSSPTGQPPSSRSSRGTGESESVGTI